MCIRDSLKPSSVASEAFLYWNISNTWSEEVVEANGEVYVILKEGKKERRLSLKGFAGKNNKAQEIFRELLTMRLISAETQLLNLMQYREGGWHEKDPVNSFFDSGDIFMVVVKPSEAHKSSTIKKSIRKESDR
eukprot:TRINITY_DN9832_c0_g1_i14.p1 TRINITY_DN9832_c0_g1~~TRINITY_DN9832_c0_g1_i14.p1  ORF type:complete len:134 (+),score=33.02 TRINITY_DN9832_c0_g1_i14:73-474(+)